MHGRRSTCAQAAHIAFHFRAPSHVLVGAESETHRNRDTAVARLDVDGQQPQPHVHRLSGRGGYRRRFRQLGDAVRRQCINRRSCQLRNADDTLVDGHAQPLLEQVAHVTRQITRCRPGSNEDMNFAGMAEDVFADECAHDRRQLAKRRFRSVFRVRARHHQTA